MSGLFLLSNNDSVVNLFKQFQQTGLPEVKYVEASATRVLQLAKDFIHRGARLYNHPLGGGSTPGDNPFKTLIISGEDEKIIHFQSLQLIEEALRAHAKAAKNRFRAYTDEQLKEFKTYDMELTMAAIQNLAAAMRGE